MGKRHMTLLGASCGDGVHASKYCDLVADRICRQTQLLADIPDPHIALTLLRFCTGFAMGVFFARAMGDQEAWKRVDQTVEDVLNAKIGPLTKAAVEELRLPIRMGGSGFRSLSWHAAIA